MTIEQLNPHGDEPGEDENTTASPTPGPATYEKRLVEIFTDGACSGNPGPGGWAAILRSPHSEAEKELSGFDPHTTNNRMEMMAAIMALEALKRPLRVRLHTDSKLVCDGVNKWLPGWKAKGWRGSGRQRIANVDLWQRLEAAMASHEMEWIWVKGHAGHPENERADKLARGAIVRGRQ